MTTQAEIVVLRVDLALPLTPDGSVPVTSTGDLALVRGRECLHHGQLARIYASPGELVHRPEYGSGLLDLVEQNASPEILARSAAQIKRSALSDSRLSDAEVSVSEINGTVEVELRIKAKGDDIFENLTLNVEV